MPHSAPACMTDVGRTVIANLKSNGMESILHYCADSFNPIDGRCAHSGSPPLQPQRLTHPQRGQRDGQPKDLEIHPVLLTGGMGNIEV